MAMTAQLGEIANVSGYKPGPALTAAGGVRSATLGTTQLYATMQGQRVLTQHFSAVGAVLPGMLAGVVQATAYVMRDQAKAFHFKNIDTQETYDSIKASDLMSMYGSYFAQVSVSTPQAKFLEFGFVHHKSGAWIHNPFMIPAADAVTPMFVDAVNQVLGIASGRRYFTGLAGASSANNMLGSVRAALYSYSKYAGDIQVLGFGGLSASRGFAIKGAKGIGNIQAAQSGTLAARAGRLVAGRIGGSAIRSGSLSPGSILSGPSGRIYNRISGRAFGGALSGIR